MITVRLRQPYWGAWKKYKWDFGVEGYGVSVEKVQQAIREHDKLEIIYGGDTYIVSGEKVQKMYKEAIIKPVFNARGQTKLIIIPRTILKKLVPKEIEQIENTDEQPDLLG